MTYRPVGTQDRAAPVISDVVVTSDDSHITFRIKTANRRSWTNGTQYWVFTDNDNTRWTGNLEQGGVETGFQIGGAGSSTGVASEFWDGSEWTAVPAQRGDEWSYSKGVLTVTVNRSEVEAQMPAGHPIPTIGFSVVAASGHSDQNRVPLDRRLYSYDFTPGVTSPPQALTAILFTDFNLAGSHYTTEAVIHPGKNVTASVLVRDKRFLNPLIAARISCEARVGGEDVGLVRQKMAPDGTAICVWRLPTDSKGKRLVGSITARMPHLPAKKRSFVAYVSG